jgi:hypothetical protein
MIYKFVVEGKNCFPQCPLCGNGLHTRTQAKACMTQNPNLHFGSKFNKYYFGRFERFWRWLLF